MEGLRPESGTAQAVGDCDVLVSVYAWEAGDCPSLQSEVPGQTTAKLGSSR